MNLKPGKYEFKNDTVKLENNLFLKRLKTKIGIYRKEFKSNTLQLVDYLNRDKEIYYYQGQNSLFYFYLKKDNINIIEQKTLF